MKRRRQHQAQSKGVNKQADPQDSSSSGKKTPLLTQFYPCPICAARSDHKKKFSIEWIKPRLEIVGILAAIALVAINGCQWNEASRQTNAAQQQLAEMQRENRLDERAWVAIPSVTFSYPKPQENPALYSLVPEFFNSGKTPAQIEKTTVSIDVGETNICVVNCAGFTLAPNGSFKPEISFTYPVKNELKASAWRAWDTQHVLTVRVNYRDVVTNNEITEIPYAIARDKDIFGTRETQIMTPCHAGTMK